MTHISSKPTVYLIDGSNFSMRFSSCGAGGTLEAEFLQWLGEAASSRALSASCFRVVFDGPYRPVGRTHTRSVDVYFSDSEPADSMLLERARFLAAEGVRVVLVSSDRELSEQARAEGVKTLGCGPFFTLCESSMKKDSR